MGGMAKKVQCWTIKSGSKCIAWTPVLFCRRVNCQTLAEIFRRNSVKGLESEGPPHRRPPPPLSLNDELPSSVVIRIAAASNLRSIPRHGVDQRPVLFMACALSWGFMQNKRRNACSNKHICDRANFWRAPDPGTKMFQFRGGSLLQGRLRSFMSLSLALLSCGPLENF